MANPTLVYHRPVNPSRPLAATGVVLPIRLVLALPHIWVPGILMIAAHFAAYVGYWVVAITGNYPAPIHQFVQMALRWATRAWAWTLGITDHYPPFESDPDFPVDLPLPQPVGPSRMWAVAGLLVAPKTLAILPHLLAGIFLGALAAIAAWFGFWVTLFTGRSPERIHDFAAGAIQWVMRSIAWLGGLNDEYPPFSLSVTPA